MASITIRNLADDVKKRLRKQAAENDRSLEAEAREILTRAAHASGRPRPLTGYDLFKPLRDVVEKYGGVELELPPRTPVRPIDFGWGEDDRSSKKPNLRGRDKAAVPARSEHGEDAALREDSREFRHSDKPPKRRRK